jgi:HD-GYP domain-containing protein (c-di-GMP phosphodiesterase class II)
MRVPLSVDELVPGMMVVELDIPWLDSPFLSNSRRIRSITDVQRLKEAGVRQVVIDTDKGLAPSRPGGSPAEPVAPEPQAASPESQAQQEPVKRSLEDELQVATGIKNKIKKVVENLHLSLERNVPLDIAEVTPLVDQTMASLARNNQALLNLVHLSRKAAKIADHTFSTFCLSLNLAVLRGIDAAEREALALAALLHEAGWVNLPLQLMGKRTAYTASEKKLIANHVEVGLALLASSQLPELTRRIIAEHHELGDGSGYPKGLVLEALHPVSRLFAVVDAYDERVHQLTDKPGMLPNNALRSLYMDSQQQRYDPQAVASLIALLGIYPVTSAVRLNTGERALVLEVGQDALRPVIKIVYDANKKPLATPLVVDLCAQPNDAPLRSIETVIDPTAAQEDPFRRLHAEE